MNNTPQSPSQEEINQCDGCLRGLPLKDGLHYNENRVDSSCTKAKYQQQPKEGEKDYDTWGIGERINTPSEGSGSWEEEFDDMTKFICSCRGNTDVHDGDCPWAELVKIKDFIRSLLASNTKEVLMEVSKLEEVWVENATEESVGIVRSKDIIEYAQSKGINL